MELNKIITGLLITILIVSGFMLFYADAANKYSNNINDYDNSSLQAIKDKQDEIYNLTERAKDELTTLQSETDDGEGNFFSAVDTFLTQGYYGMIIASKSMEQATDLTQLAVSKNSQATGGFSVQTATILSAIIVIVITIGVIAAVLLTKAPRL